MSSEVTIERVEQRVAGLQVWLDGVAEALELPWYWIRDHSEDPTALDRENMQRTVDTFSIDRSLAASSVEHDGATIHVNWRGDTPTSVLTADTIGRLLPPPRPMVLWRNPADAAVPTVDHAAVMDTDEGLRRWLESIAAYGFGLVSGAPTHIEGAEALARRIGYIRRTVFGSMWTLSSEVKEYADSAYGADTLQPHTDGTYSHDGPGMQFFVCSERTGTGGESVLVDGFAAAEALRSQDPEAFRLLTKVDVPARYIDDGVHLVARRPTIRLDGEGEVLQVSLNNYDRAPFVLPEPTMSAWYDAYAALHELTNDESSWWKIRLEPGDALIFDNWRCLHGRMAYTGKRVFHGGYINHEDLESRLRVMG